MNSYSIYSIKTGQILRIHSSLNDPAVSDDEAYIDGRFEFDAFYIDSGVAIETPPRPSEHHVFDYTTKNWIDPRTPETQWSLIRAERDRRLAASDWTALLDVPLDASSKQAWSIYRQALRDITQQPDPFNIVWPTAPF